MEAKPRDPQESTKFTISTKTFSTVGLSERITENAVGWLVWGSMCLGMSILQIDKILTVRKGHLENIIGN